MAASVRRFRRSQKDLVVMSHQWASVMHGTGDGVPGTGDQVPVEDIKTSRAL